MTLRHCFHLASLEGHGVLFDKTTGTHVMDAFPRSYNDNYKPLNQYTSDLLEVFNTVCIVIYTADEKGDSIN